MPYPLSDDITQSQKEKFLVLMTHNSDIMADNLEDLGRTAVSYNTT